MEALRNNPSLQPFIIRSKVVWGLILIGSAAVTYGSQPSFDCNRASTPTEKAIAEALSSQTSTVRWGNSSAMSSP